MTKPIDDLNVVEVSEDSYYATDAFGVDFYVCPTCGDQHVRYRDKQCGSCGQRLKWHRRGYAEWRRRKEQEDERDKA